MCKTISGIILGFTLLGGVAFAQTSNIQAPPAVFPAQVKEIACTQEAKLCPDDGSYVSRTSPNCEFAACPSVSAPEPSVIPPFPIPPSVNVATPPVSALPIKKCGVNTYRVSSKCGVGAFKNAYVQCYDGYEENPGGESSCKSSEVWQKYAQEICANRCGIAEVKPVPIPAPKPLPSVEVKPTEVKPIAICYIPDKLTKDYNRLILDLRKAEGAGDPEASRQGKSNGASKETAELIIKKITALKLEIERARKECLANAPQSGAIQQSTKESRMPAGQAGPSAPVSTNRCVEIAQWENKIAYYQKLAALSDSELKEQTGFSKAEIERILADLPNGLVKVKAQCDFQKTAGARSLEAVKQIIAEPVKPVVVESGQEIDEYYKARIEKITIAGSAEEQVEKLKSLKGEIDELITKLIKGRKEVEASEFNNVVSEIKVSRGEIKADDIAIKTTDKKIFVNVGNTSVSVAPTSRATEIIEIKDGGGMAMKVTASEVSISDNVLRVGASEVKLAASKVAETLGVEPQSAELKEENSRAVYKLKVAEPRKLFGFIPIQITKTLTADAESSYLMDESRPWYSFLTTR